MKLLLFSADVREAGRDVVIKTSVPYMVNKPTDHLVRFCLYLKGCKRFFSGKKKDLQHVTYKTKTYYKNIIAFSQDMQRIFFN